ncbi:MAG: GntR family transcriptional regulator [bacterium]
MVRVGRKAPARGSRVEEAYHHLKLAIVSAKLPAGSLISEIDIARELGISRTPMREAIRQLERDGLVVRFPNRGVFVRQVEMREVLEIWQIREWLEPIACEVAAKTIAPEPLQRLRQRMTEVRESVTGLEEHEVHHQLDLELHAKILEAAGNITLQTLVDSLNIRVMQMRMVHRPDRLQAVIAEHIEILDALLARDPYAAANAMRKHLRNSRENLAFA